MTFDEFKEKIQSAVLEKLGEGYQTKVQEVQKNNGVFLQGLVLIEEDKNVSPMIYLEPFWEAYTMGMPFSIVLERILQICEEDMPKTSVDLSFFHSFDKVKDKICFRLISREKNQELLTKLPYREYLDLAICFFYAYEGEELGEGSILIHNSHMQMWHTSKEELFELAKENTKRLYPMECESMENVINKMMHMRMSENGSVPWTLKEQTEFLEQMPMWVISNVPKIYGATSLLYEEELYELAKKAGQNFYIIPSSVHEVILLGDCCIEEIDSLKEMIREVNRTQVDRKEVLSDHLYHYDRERREMTIV